MDKKRPPVTECPFHYLKVIYSVKDNRSAPYRRQERDIVRVLVVGEVPQGRRDVIH